jgi:hypothetical protein
MEMTSQTDVNSVRTDFASDVEANSAQILAPTVLLPGPTVVDAG